LVKPPVANAHSGAQHYLIGSGHAEAQRAGTLLSSLHSDRIKADYRLSEDRFQDVRFARLRVELAHEIRSALEACGTEKRRSLVKQGIAQYLQKIGRTT
jgi:hypothetical protein